MAKPNVKLGQKVFVLSEDGQNIIRTMVAGIENDGDYKLLNGSSNRRPHWFSFNEAIGAVCERLEARMAKLLKVQRQLAAKKRELQKENYRDSVESAPYKMVDPGYGESKKFRSCTKGQVAVPKKYLRPGQCVYVVITPMTSQQKDLCTYKPYTHFVLETEVKSVRLSSNGKALYTFTSPLRPEEPFLSREEAEARLRSYSEPGTLEEVPFVSKEQETKELRRLNGLDDDDVPF